ncbi:MAG: hypothetical protein OZ948_08360 [Deltaproteobacteria bacterium]|nr:hypothetical protein [Deltaproteobacteria bacterium]
MQRLAILVALAACAACAGSGGSGAETAEPLRRETTQVTAIHARVKAIDQRTRRVTLVDDAGGEAVFQADEGVKNLAQVKPGDILEGELAESVVLEVREPTPQEAAEGASILEVAATAEPGRRPAGLFARRITAVLVIEGIDRAAGTATLRGPAGVARVVPVRNPANLDRVAVGDTVVATYTESLALEVREPQAP